MLQEALGEHEQPEALHGLDLIRYWAELEHEKRALEDKLKEVKARQAQIEERVQEVFAETGMQNVRIAGLTVYLERKLWAKREEGVTMEEACAALKEAGLGDLVTEGYNSHTLSAYLRELERTNQPLPPELEGKITAAEVFSVRARASS